ncbi:ganglioside-induced differentiation-associated protein 1-like [Glandiceps talaboti]
MEMAVTLYHEYISYYSQRARLALVEKGISYDSRILSGAKCENVDPWFIRLNPRGKIPVIVHGENIIYDTPRILEYLDEKFPNKICLNKDGEEGKRVQYFRDFVNGIEIGDVMAGIFRHPHLVPKPGNFPVLRIPQIIKLVHEDIPKKAAELAEKHPDLKDTYLQKIKKMKEEAWDSPTEEYFKTILSKIDQLLTEVEKELQETMSRIHNGERFLCGKQVSAADIFLIVLINRLEQYGLGEMFWTDGKRPLVASYLEWMLSRESCKKALPSFKPK